MTQPVMSVPSGWSARARIKSDSRSLGRGLAGLRAHALLEAQRIAAVRVVAAVAAELPVAALAIAGDGGVVSRAHLEADRLAAAGARGRLGGGKEKRADAAPPRVRRDRDRIKPRERQARAGEDDRCAGAALSLLRTPHPPP